MHTKSHTGVVFWFFFLFFVQIQRCAGVFLLLKTTEGSFQRGVCINITNRRVFFYIQVSQFGLVDLDCYLGSSVSMFVTLGHFSSDSKMTRKAVGEHWNAKHKYFRYSR